MSNREDPLFEKFDLAMKFRRGLRGETDRGRALMAAEYLSNQLAELLRAAFVDDHRACDAMLDEPVGHLNSFGSRIEFAYLMGLVGPTAKRELNLIRKIRNDFAHQYKPLTFSDQRIAARCRELRAHNTYPENDPKVDFTRTVMGLLAVIHVTILSTKHAKPIAEPTERPIQA